MVPGPGVEVPSIPPPSVIDYPILFRPESAQAAVTMASRNRTGRIVSLILSVGILVALYFLFLEALGGISWPFVVIGVGLPVVQLILAIIREVRVRKEASRAVPGLALGVTRTGLITSVGWWPWEAVTGLVAKPGFLGTGPQLLASSHYGATVALPLAHLSVPPANVDNAIATLSDGRHRVDFTKLGA